jgi:hypothetical protein
LTTIYFTASLSINLPSILRSHLNTTVSSPQAC